MNNKKGSSAVFLSVIFAALVSITLILIYSARELNVASRTDAALNLACDSIMSEFDYNVQKEYGLFMINGTDNELTEKMYEYAETTLRSMDNVEIESCKVSGSRFSLVNRALIKEQLIEYMKMIIAENLISKKINGNNMTEKSLRHGPTEVSLPSRTVEKKSITALAESIAEKRKNISSVFKSGSEKYLITGYIITHFNSRVNAVSEEHFFKNEIEYILGGETTDKKNEKRIEIALKALRFPLNLAHIYSDKDKNAATLALAQIMTPGAAATATQAVLASTWAYAESDNDVELLWQGHSVPFTKDSKSWAMDLEGAVEGVTGGTAVPLEEKGYTYDEYLRILLHFQDEDMQIARILDLIQINMRKSYNSGFLIHEYAAGITAEVIVNGREYSYEKKY